MSFHEQENFIFLLQVTKHRIYVVKMAAYRTVHHNIIHVFIVIFKIGKSKTYFIPHQ